MLRRLPALVVAVGAVAAFGCGDATGIRATFENEDERLTVFALNGTPVTVPTAVLVRNAAAVRIDANFLFDLAFDIDTANRVIVHTQRAVASQLVPGHPVGIQLSDETFDKIRIAPTTGFHYDTSMVFPVNKVLLVDVIENACGGSFLGPNIRAKIAIDSVVPSRKSIYLHILPNRNCGFRSLVAGELPKE